MESWYHIRMKKLIIANWKMNPATEAKAKSLFAGLSKIRAPKTAQIVICPPLPYIPSFKKAKIDIGAQNVSVMEATGAFTGEVSAKMLKDVKVSYVIIGHSERRAMGETDAQVARKTDAVLAAGMYPIVCVGEPEDIRAQGDVAAQRYVLEQLEQGLRPALHHAKFASRCIVAYEPLWAIGTGKACRPEDADSMARAIADFVSSHLPPALAKGVRVLYGGSVNKTNAADFLALDSIGGVLVGGASLVPREFAGIVASE